MTDSKSLSVAFVELPDEALDVLSHYSQHPDVTVVLVVGMEPDSYAVRMAEILKIPVLDVPNRFTLSSADRIIVGPQPDDLLAEMQDMMDGTPASVVPLEDVLQALGLSDTEDHVIEAAAGADAIDGALRRVVDPHLDATDSADPEADLSELPHESLDVREPGQKSDAPVIEDDPDDTPSDEDEIWRIWSGEEPAPGLGLVHGPREDNDPADDTEEPKTKPEPKPDPVMAGAGGFDAGALLGEDLRDEIGALMLDTTRGDLLNRILDMAIRATHTQTGSIMLLDEDGRHLRIAVAEGLPIDVVASVRQKTGEGVSGRVFQTGEPQIVRGRSRSDDDRGLRPRLREAAVVPILNNGRAIGVLCVNSESENTTLNDKTLALLARFAKEVSAAVLKAIDLARLEGNALREALLRHVERLMALEESLGHRLRAVGDAVARTFEAEVVHVFLVDPLGQRLERVTPQRGMPARGAAVPVDKGMLGWIVRHGAPRALELWTDDGEQGMANFFVPIGAGRRPRGVLVLEGVPLEHRGADRALATLSEITDRVGDMIDVEKNLEAQELLSQLQIRIAERSSHFAGLLPHERARAVLEFSGDLLAAETAVWVPAEGAPVWARPRGAETAAIQRKLKAKLGEVAKWVRANEGAAGGFDLPGWSTDAPDASVPYAGVRVPAAGGVLIVAFHESDSMGPLAQAPPDVLYEIIRGLGAHLPTELTGGTSRAA